MSLMNEYKWELLGPGGETFQALIATLILWEDRDAIAFRRSGKDCGIDALSGDKRRVIQAKYRCPGTVAQIFSTAKKEFKSISKMREEDRCRALWTGVKEWELVTNVSFNPNDVLKWETEIRPLFENIGLKAELTEMASLEARLSNFPELKEAFFGAKNRVFLSLPEAQNVSSSLIYDKDALDIKYVGHEIQFKSVKKFIESEKRILLIQGIGGIGKTRFLLEAAQNQVKPEWLVLWANVETMDARSDWLLGIPRNRHTLVCLDNPSTSLLKLILEQASIASGSMAEWKIAITTRAANNELIQLTHEIPDDIKSLITLKPLDESDSKKLAVSLLEHYEMNTANMNWLDDVSKKIYSLSEGIPLWITIPVKMLKNNGDLKKLPQRAGEIAKKYIKQAVLNSDPIYSDKMIPVLQCISLLGELNIEDEVELEFIAEFSQLANISHLKRVLLELSSMGFLFRKGIQKRLFYVKPDPFADQFLEDWLLIGLDSPNDVELDQRVYELISLIGIAVLTGHPSVASKISAGLMRCSDLVMYEYEKNIDIFRAFYDKYEEQINSISIQDTLMWIKYFLHISSDNPSRILDICKKTCAREYDPQEIEDIFKRKSMLTKRHILEEVPWLVFNASQYVTSLEDAQQAFNILIHLVEEKESREKATTDMNRDKSKTPSVLLARILSEDANFPESFPRVAMNYINNFLVGISEISGEKANVSIILLESVIAPLLAEESMSPIFGKTKYILKRIFHGPGSEAWERRKIIKISIMTLLEGTFQSDKIRINLWKLLEDTHMSLVRSRRKTQSDLSILEKLIADQKEDLQWLLDQLTAREFTVSELCSARPIWDWHVAHEGNRQLRNIAVECENESKKSELFKRFKSFSDTNDTDTIRKLSHDMSNRILEHSTVSSMIHIIDEAAIFFQKRYGWNFSWVANELASQSLGDERIEQLVKTFLNMKPASFQYQFAIKVCISWLSNNRERAKSAEVIELCNNILSWCEDNSTEINVLVALYRRALLVEKNIDEIIMLRSYETLFLSAGRVTDFLSIISSSAVVEFSRFKEIVERLISDLSYDEREEATYKIFHQFYLSRNFFLHGSESEESREFINWMLKQIVYLPKMSIWNDNLLAELDTMLGNNKPKIQWLHEVLNRRLQMASEDKEFVVVPFNSRISEIIAPLPPIGSIDCQEALAVRRILDLTTRNAYMQYELPKYIHDIDPSGRIAPKFIKRFIEDNRKNSKFGENLKWARIASTYEDNSLAWRTIAESVCDLAADCDEAFKVKLWREIEFQASDGWSAPVGQVAQVFYDAVSDAEKKLDEETHLNVKLYRMWVLDRTRNELEHQKQRIEEEGF